MDDDWFTDYTQTNDYSLLKDLRDYKPSLWCGKNAEQKIMSHRAPDVPTINTSINTIKTIITPPKSRQT